MGKCIICGRFMKDQGFMPDPENIEEAVYKTFYCKKDDWWQHEFQYYKGVQSSEGMAK